MNPDNRVDVKFTLEMDGMILNVYHPAKGFGLPKHDHTYRHGTMCVAGSLQVRKENLELVLTKDSAPVILKELEWHELEALEDGTIFINVFAKDKY